MSRSIKLGVIGAGSAQFSLGLVRDLCLAESLYGSTVTFMDIDEGRLGMVHRLAVRYAAELGVDLRFEATTEREWALREADFVLNTALPGGHGIEEECRAATEAIGYYRGLRQLQTNLRQFGLMLSIARDMERLCPNAWLVQSANPVFEGCTLMTRETGIKVVGLCHGYHGYRRLCDAIGVPADEVRWSAPGVNHWIYLTEFRHQGRDLYPLLDRWIEEEAPAYWRKFDGAYNETQLSRGAIDHYRRVGLMPVGDAARTFSEWYYHADLETERRWYGPLGGFDSAPGWARYLARLEQNLARIGAVAADESARVTAVFPPEPTREIQVPIIDALANDRPGIFQVNVPNNGAIAGIADDVVVEGQALVDGAGIHLLQVGALPEKLLRLVILPRIAKAEKELLAYRSGDRDVLVSALLDDGRTRSLEQAEAAADVLLGLPWNGELANRFGGAKRRRAPLPEYDLTAARSKLPAAQAGMPAAS
jgi:alpha-galactosidase/6-phospho-beta-glucosidase family protein